MPYVDIGQRTNTIGHCRRCERQGAPSQWVVAPNTKGVKGSTSKPRSGQVCPFCKSSSVYYTQEDNR